MEILNSILFLSPFQLFLSLPIVLNVSFFVCMCSSKICIIVLYTCVFNLCKCCTYLILLLNLLLAQYLEVPLLSNPTAPNCCLVLHDIHPPRSLCPLCWERARRWPPTSRVPGAARSILVRAIYRHPKLETT